jgi:uncharacterized membrane protein
MKNMQQTQANDFASDETPRSQPLPELNDLVEQNLEAVVRHHMEAERNVDYHQRSIEKIMATIGRPHFLYTMIAIIGSWILLQYILRFLGGPVFDPAPFSWLQGLISFSALCVSVMVLITQNRQEIMHERRRHLDLQVTLLTEQEVTKIIRLLEELRRDSPFISNRVDPEVEAMQQDLNPHHVMQELDHKFYQPEPGTPSEDKGS